MDITTYQREARRTMRTDLTHYDNLSMLGLGIAGESGEVIEIIKKHLYHEHELNKKEVEKELGDLLFYIANLATILDLSLEVILEGNIEKLKVRYPQGFSFKASIARVDTK